MATGTKAQKQAEAAATEVTPENGPSIDVAKSEVAEDWTYSASERATLRQAAMEMCATCAHLKGSQHPEDGPCRAEHTFLPEGPGGPETTIRCNCREFWPMRHQREDGEPVTGHSVTFGGSAALILDRRMPTQLWDALRVGQPMRLQVNVEVDAKGFKRDKEFGLIETRKLVVTSIVIGERHVDPETGEVS